MKDTIVITKRGEKVAKIIPFTIDKKRAVSEILKDMQILNQEVIKNSKITLKDIQEMRTECRK